MPDEGTAAAKRKGSRQRRIESLQRENEELRRQIAELLNKFVLCQTK
jgi:hypothetical protein